MPSTKIELNHNKIARIRGLDEFAALLFPRNRRHQRVFLAIFIEIKYADGEFLPVLKPLCNKYGFSPRMLETVRSKMRRLGTIDHISRFSKTHGYKDGWVLSTRFCHSLTGLAKLTEGFKERNDSLQESKDRDLFRYL
jgi:hypothetical protein